MNNFMKKSVAAGAAVIVLLGAVLSVAHATTITGTPTVINNSSPGAQISWTTDLASDSQVNYGLSPTNLSNFSASRCDQGGMILAHCINLTGLTSGTLYYYKVMSYASGQGMAESPVYSFTSLGSEGGGGSSVPDAPTGFTYSTPTSTSIPLSWNASPNADKYNIYREVAGSASWSFVYQVVGATSYTDSGLTPATTYNYHIDACLSGSGCSASYAYLYNVTTAAAPDVTAPSAPTNFSAVPYSSTESRLTWGTSIDNVGVTGYKIFRNNALITTTPSDTSAYSDGPLASGTSYSYFIKAIDAAGNESANAYATVMMPVIATIPLAPTNVHIASGATAISLQWTDNATNEDKWNIERKLSAGTEYVLLTQILSANITAYTDTSASNGVLYDYRVQACLSGVGCSEYTTVSGVSFGSAQSADTESPTAPTTISATALSSSQVSVSWSGATDNVGVMGYKIYRNGTYYIGLTNTTYTDSNVTPDTLYTYAIKAVDAAGNVSPAGVTQEVRTPAAGVTATSTPPATTDTILPTAPYEFSQVSSSTSISFTFAGASDNVGVVAYKIFRNGAFLKTVYDPYCTDVGLVPNTTYSYYVKAVDAAGNESLPTQTISVTTLTAFIAPTLATTQTATTTITAPLIATSTTSAMLAKVLVSVRVESGASFCDGLIGKTKMTFTAIPSTGAYFKIVRNSTDATNKVPGIYDLPNGTYRWEGIANPGFMFDHIASDSFVLSKSCETAVTTATPPPPATVTETNTTNLIISSPSVMEPVAVVVTEEQFANYCDDPLHRTECQTYAAEKIITRSAQTVVETPSVSGGTVLNQEAPVVNEEVTQVLAQRIGARMFQDTDSDGITDYDEVNIYYTDPKRHDTNDDGVNDGDQLLSGTDPLAEKTLSLSTSTPTPIATSTRIVSTSASSNAIAYENPKLAGEKKPFLLTVNNVERKVKEDPDTLSTSTTLVLSGTALPNSFVTLYIFSDPIVVRVKADSSGAWIYTLDQELPDGSHEVVSAITDTGGRILAKSEAAPFVKTAAAVSFGATELLPTQSAPSFFSGTYFYLLIGLFVALLLVAFVVVGMMVKQKTVREGDGGMAL
jgi:fibronectin type 3 domain-containing protein